MAFSFVCPLPAALTALPTQNCPIVIGQIVRLAIRRTTARTSTAATNFTSVADILNKAKWTAAMAATDNTKIIITPKVVNFVIPVSNPLTNGGNDNTTIDGVAQLTGYESQSPTWNFEYMSANILKVLKSYTPYSLDGGLEVFLLNGAGNVIYDASNVNEDDEVVPQGFRIYNFGVGGTSSQGFNTPVINNGQFSLEDGWDDNLAIAATALEGTPSPWKARDLIA